MKITCPVPTVQNAEILTRWRACFCSSNILYIVRGLRLDFSFIKGVFNSSSHFVGYFSTDIIII